MLNRHYSHRASCYSVIKILQQTDTIIVNEKKNNKIIFNRLHVNHENVEE